MWRRFSSVIFLSLVLLVFVWSVRAQSNDEEDSSAGLPREYAAKYLIAARSLSPDKKTAVLYPRSEVCDDEKNQDCKDLLVALKPFRILATVETKRPYFQHESHGGISADWLRDSSVMLLTLESKWGPGDVFLYEFKEGNLSRATDLLGRVRDLLEPDFKKAKPEPYNDQVPFVFEGEDRDVCGLEPTVVRIRALATTDPKHDPGVNAWDARAEAVWDIAKARFSAKGVSRLFAGVRKGD